MLIVVKGEEADNAILNLAFKKRPSLIIDCANCADPYKLNIEEEWMDEVYIINAEAIYRFRDALKKIDMILTKLKLNRLFITSIAVLFSYDDKLEDKNVITSCWKLIKELSKKYDIYAVEDIYSIGLADEIWDTQYLVKEL